LHLPIVHLQRQRCSAFTREFKQSDFFFQCALHGGFHATQLGLVGDGSHRPCLGAFIERVIHIAIILAEVRCTGPVKSPTSWFVTQLTNCTKTDQKPTNLCFVPIPYLVHSCLLQFSEMFLH